MSKLVNIINATTVFPLTISIQGMLDQPNQRISIKFTKHKYSKSQASGEGGREGGGLDLTTPGCGCQT